MEQNAFLLSAVKERERALQAGAGLLIALALAGAVALLLRTAARRKRYERH